MRLEVVLVVVVDDEEARRDLTRDVCVFLIQVVGRRGTSSSSVLQILTYTRSEVLNYRHYFNRRSVI